MTPSVHDVYLTPPDQGDALCSYCRRANLDNPATPIDAHCERTVGTAYELCIGCCHALAWMDGEQSACEDCDAIVAECRRVRRNAS